MMHRRFIPSQTIEPITLAVLWERCKNAQSSRQRHRRRFRTR
ncbi:hypothetical protein OSCI_1000017 [Kamptonema sp. PCC 6506]|nr:hypothetical protein OSCI_1000017 [Kamptonema sp. PCC 6506]